MKKSNLKEVYTYVNQTTEKEVDFESVDLENNKIKHIIIGNKKVTPVKKQSSMTTKQFQEFVIEFIKKQDETNKIVVQRLDKQEIFNQQQLEFNKMVMQRFDNIENDIKEIKIRLDKIESCPTIKKELNI